MRRLLEGGVYITFSLCSCGVYWGAALNRGNTVFENPTGDSCLFENPKHSCLQTKKHYNQLLSRSSQVVFSIK